MFPTYNELFDYLDNECAWLRRKRKALKKDLLPAIDAPREKHCTYYGATEGHQCVTGTQAQRAQRAS